MRQLAGVLLIIAACLNLFASGGYLLGGALTAGVSMGIGSLGDDIVAELATEERQAVPAEFSNGMDEVAGVGVAAGSTLVVFGAFLLAAFGVLIAGAVFLFKGVRPKFIIVAAVVALLAEAGGISITQFSIFNLFGLIGGVVALLAAKQLRPQKPAESAKPPVETISEVESELHPESDQGPFDVPALADGSMALVADVAPVAPDAVEKKLIAVMVVGMLLMVGSGTWYFFGSFS